MFFFFTFDAGWVRWELRTGGATESVSAGGPPTSAQSCGTTLSGGDGLQPRWERTMWCGGPAAEQIKSTPAAVFKHFGWRMNLCPLTIMWIYSIDAKERARLRHYDWMTHSRKCALKWAFFFWEFPPFALPFLAQDQNSLSCRESRVTCLGKTSSASLSPPRLGLLHWFVCLFQLIKEHFFSHCPIRHLNIHPASLVWHTIHFKVNRAILKRLIQCHFVYFFVVVNWLNTTNRKSLMACSVVKGDFIKL